MDAYENRRINDRHGLSWISRFGWLRTAELGKLLWPGNATNRQQADRLVRGWLARKLVLARELPDRAGRALVLATAGVRLLNDFGIESRIGKDIGAMSGEKWSPPRTWRHDLLAAGVLADLHEKGYDVVPEAEIRQTAGSLGKIPDGLARQGDVVIWLEVESARKTGLRMRELASGLNDVAVGRAPHLAGIKATHAMVAYMAEARDERGCKLSHRQRVKQAVAAMAIEDVRIFWAECFLRGPAGVGRVKYEDEVLVSDAVARIRSTLEVGGWVMQDNGCLMATYRGYTAYIWQDGDESWSYLIDGHLANYAGSQRDAKHACASEIAKLSRR